jgi:hypothetical protein
MPTNVNNTMTTTATIRRDLREKERAFTTCKCNHTFVVYSNEFDCFVLFEDLREYGADFKEINSKTIDDDWKNAENVREYVE